MKKNIGVTDRYFRIILAIVFAVLHFTGMVSGLFGTILLVLAILLLLASLVQYCPLYMPFGINTRKKS